MRFTHFPPILIFVFAVLLLGGGYQWGRLAAGETDFLSTSSGGEVTGINGKLFSEAWRKLHDNFVGELNDTTLSEGAIEGMVKAAGDPYTVYLDPQEAKELSDGLQGVFSGIGAEIGFKNKRLVIIAPLPDSPAAKAGLKPQDIIEEINDQSVADMSLVDAVRLIRGERGTEVKLVISRDGLEEPQTFMVMRDQIEIKSVTSEVRSDGIGYVKISGFHEDTRQLTDQALTEFVTRNVRGIIIDLRGNPGGLLNSGIDVTSLFLAEGVVVKQREKSGTIKTYDVTVAAKVSSEIKILVLVDAGSASAAEIMAGALQDHKRAVLIGEKTFGKGSVQELENLDNGGKLKVTVAEWLTPNDRGINGTGIDPDIVVAAATEAGTDPQLDRALEELKK